MTARNIMVTAMIKERILKQMDDMIVEMDAIKEYCEEEELCYNDNFENYRKSIITTVAFLIGVPDEKFAMEGRFDPEEYEKLQKDEKAIIIRKLCILRTQFLRNYKPIMDARKYEMRPLETMSEYLDIDAIKYLRRYDIEVNVSNAQTPTVNIAYINQYILDNITGIKHLIPDWVKFEYIKSIFLMPGCYAGHGGGNIKNNYKKIFNTVHEIGKAYASQRTCYPYQMYISWPFRFREDDGNILYNDLKFLKMLYAALGDRFQAVRYVVDAKADTKEGIYDFLDGAINVAIFVDCENVDPYAFAATILNLDEENITKIKKIVLYDDANTSTAWDYIRKIMPIPVVKKDIKRLLYNKSLVDITMAAGVCEEFYCNNMESIILASSDSDFWGLIQQLPSARFLVLNEKIKTSSAILDQLDKNNIPHCYMSDFAQDVIQRFKSEVLYLGLLERIKKFNETGEFQTLDIHALIQEIFYDACIVGAESQIQKEKEAFYNKYFKNGLIIKPVYIDGTLKLQIEISIK